MNNQTTIVCYSCGAVYSAELTHCPQCATPTPAQVYTSAGVQMQSVPGKISKKTATIIFICVLITAAFAAIWGAAALLGTSCNSDRVDRVKLEGDELIAYRIVVRCADEFDNPETIRLLGGELGVDKDCLFCYIQYENADGKRVKEYYFLDKAGWGIVAEKPYSWYSSTDVLDLDKINEKLEDRYG